MESLITFLAILIISAIGTWLKKFAEKQSGPSARDPQNQPPSTNQQGQQRPPIVSVPRPERKAVSWEDELRRLLGEEEPLKPRIPPTAPPPKPPPSIAPKPVAPPPVISQPAPKAPPVVRRIPSPDVVPLPVPAVERVSTTNLAKLEESRTAYERASQLDRLAAERIKKVSEQPVGLTSVVVRKTAGPEVTETLSLMKNKRGAREGIIASIILGPPRGLKEMM